MDQIRQGIHRVGRPFEYILDRLDLPEEMAGVGGRVCLAEETLNGVQVAVEGYEHDGEITVYGVLDSINYPDSTSFLRHQYPSALPEPVQERLREVSKRVMRHIGWRLATFSIEFFYDPATDGISILEINPRHSQAHAELFAYVDGVPNHHCMLALALGENPAMPVRQGPYALAAKWYYRWFADGIVREVPSPEELARIEKEIPGVRIDIVPDEGQRLSDVDQQDSYSYELAHIFTGVPTSANCARSTTAVWPHYDSPSTARPTRRPTVRPTPRPERRMRYIENLPTPPGRRTTSGSRCRTASTSPRASGARSPRTTRPSRRSWSTSRTARAT